MNDSDYMKKAFQLALKGQGETSPNPMVGAVIVKNGRVIGQGWHRRAGGPHAEIFALRQAGKKAQGATLYVTLEPCYHFGRTPPCVDAVLHAGVKKIIVGMRDPNPLTHGRSLRKLRQAGVRVEVGVLEAELRSLNEAFVTYVTQKKPFVTAKIAQTFDGKVATASGQSQWITDSKTRAFTRHLRADFDAIMVGVNTVCQDDPRLTSDQKKKRLFKIVVDSRLSIPSKAKVLKESPQDCLIATTHQAARSKIKELEDKGATVLVGPCSGRGVDLRWLFRELARREMTHVLLEGGPTLIGEALRLKLIDKFYIFLAPKILGDDTARSSVRGVRCVNVNQAFQLKDFDFMRIGPDIFVTAYPRYR